MSLISDTAAVETFIPLADVEAPPMPTQEVLRRLLARLQALIGRQQSKPFIADDKLKKATLDRLNEVVAPPACGPLLAELGRTVDDWRGEALPSSHFKVIVLPPCDDNDVVETWAREAGHQILDTPTRGELVGTGEIELPNLAGEDVLVVPRLEMWFLRHRQGLRAVRRLLADLDGLRRPIVIGCNSWAWAFLAKAIGADLMLPDAVTFKPFDQVRLHEWFSQLARADPGAEMPGIGGDPQHRLGRGAEQ